MARGERSLRAMTALRTGKPSPLLQQSPPLWRQQIAQRGVYPLHVDTPLSKMRAFTPVILTWIRCKLNVASQR